MSVETANHQPTVNILVPTYNRANYLRETIQSVLVQTYENIEVLVFDDASPDNTPSVMAEFLAEPRVAYVRHSTNLGMAGNWKAAIEAATGEFFCLLNDDDTLEPDFIESLLFPLLNNEDLILSFCDHWIMDSKGLRLCEESEKNTRQWNRSSLEGRLQDFAYSALVDRSSYIGATLFRRSTVISDFIDERAKGFADAWLFYQYVKTGYGAYYIPKRLMNYRVHSGGMSRTQSWRPYMTEGNLFWYQQMLSDPEMSGIHKFIEAEMASVLTEHGLGLLASGKHREAYHAFKESLQLKRRAKALAGYSLASLGSLGTTTVVMLKNLRQTVRKAKEKD